MATPDASVRQCARCGAPAMVTTAAWSHAHFGMNTGAVTRDCRCQACGARVTLRARARLTGFAIAGVLLLPTCIGLPILGVTWWWWQQEARNPVVPDAPQPVRRFRDGPPLRRCGSCRELAAAKTVTRNRTNGLPTGTEYGYVCGGCGARFTVESPWGHAFSAMAGAVVTAIAVAFAVWGEGRGWRFGGAAVFGLAALFVGTQSALRLWRRVRNPVVVVPLSEGPGPGSPASGPISGAHRG